MGRKHPDRIPIENWRAAGGTVQQMIDAGWEVISVCAACRLEMLVQLDVIARISGPQTTLWNRKARCRRLLCPGWVSFHAKIPGRTLFQELKAPDQERMP